MTTVAAGTNWAGNYAYRAGTVHTPRSVEELQELVRGADALRALGSRHCFNDIADSPGDLVSLASMPSEVTVDPESRTARVNSGASYGAVAGELEAQGWALGNLASLPHISIAGAVATGTHGSGRRNGSLADAVTAVELVDGEGRLRRFARGTDDEFPGTVVTLGALGIVTTVELRVEPTFRIAQHVFDGVPFEAALERFPEVMGAAYSVSLFTSWSGPVFDQAWVKRREDEPDPGESFFGAPAAPVDRHPIASMPALNATPQLGEPGPWLDRLPHFKLAFTPSAGEELQSEYLLPFEDAVPALRAVAGMADRIAPLLQISEIRTVRADDLWLSPSSGADAVALHFTWVQDEEAVRALLPSLEDALAPFGARPHWGKLFAARADRMRDLYPRLPEFVRLAEALDPRGVFRNDYLERVVFSG
ncbi:D-arabinono-1,4-lactone oxidase [Naasia sp. SYSU D00057]|uniref:D-arabinono-1,4-lactone oxidase n=1 Tax=Naasia sp. SYSU D00057 TaxID=2817380 RepID=UPI001B3136FE|nr:D-arabinono-1,4-lactone oxidase [Naasia sp. SYSU D00057]